MKPRIPLFVLAGSDQRPSQVPDALSADDMLHGFKGALTLPNGRALAAEVIARVRATDRFLDPMLVGPRRIYEGLVDGEIIDCEGTIVATLTRLAETIQTRFAAAAAIGITTCDILPTPAQFNELLAREYDPHEHCHFFWQWIAAAPEALGASSWKPRYAIRRTDDAEPEFVYPGHLVIFRPAAVRLQLLIEILSLAYRYRNWAVHKRVLPMLVRGIGRMLINDLRNLARGQAPTLTFSIPWHLLRAYGELRAGRLSFPGLERHTARVFLHRDFRRTPRPVVIAVTDLIAFAQDIDTKPEWDAICAQIASGR
jgi:hypothetical protein